MRVFLSIFFSPYHLRCHLVNLGQRSELRVYDFEHSVVVLVQRLIFCVYFLFMHHVIVVNRQEFVPDGRFLCSGQLSLLSEVLQKLSQFRLLLLESKLD